MDWRVKQTGHSAKMQQKDQPGHFNTDNRPMTTPTQIAQSPRLAPLSLLLLAAILCGCSAEDPGGDEHGHDDVEMEAHDEHAHEGEDAHDADEQAGGGEKVHLEPDAVESSDIEVTVAEASTERTTISLPAVVALREDGTARVGSIIPGRIVRLSAGEGDWKGKGSVMAVIESADVGVTRAEYLEAVAAERRARAELERQETLAGERVGAGRNLEEARSALAAATAAREEAEGHLRTLGLNPRNLGPSSNRITISAPISGIVTSRPVTLGEYVEPSDDLFTLVNTSTVWVDAQATPEQAGRLAVGEVAFVRGPDRERISGKIIYIAPTLDPESRTATVRAEIANRGNAFRPGSFVTFEGQTSGRRQVIALPSGAIDREGEDLYVWRQVAEGTFERVAIASGGEIGNRMVVTAGIEEGDTIVTSGVFYLRSALKAGELSEHHH